jgi:Flp pilus assembly protein TadG
MPARNRPGNRRERGSILVFGALSMIVLAGMATMAVDYGFLQYKRSQLQNAVDAAALAGAAELVRSGGNMLAATDTAVRFGQANLDDQDIQDVAVTNSDVAFYQGETVVAEGSADAVGVTAGRTLARGNAVDMFLGKALGWDTQDLTATARASIFCSTQTRCPKPFSPPAKFTWNDSCDTSAKYRGNGALDPASSCEMASVAVLGYGPQDLGTSILLKLGDASDTVVPGHFNPVDYPPANRGAPESGASIYRLNIAGCTASNTGPVGVGDELQVEPGNMVGPTNQGLDELFALDPNATWDSAAKRIIGSRFSDPMKSPRVALIPFYDPSRPQVSGRNTIYVHQLGAVFIESVSKGGDVTGRFIRAMAVDPQRGPGTPCGADSVALFGVGLVR